MAESILITQINEFLRTMIKQIIACKGQNLSSLSSIIVTFNPDHELLFQEIANLPPDSSLVIADNCSATDVLQEIQKLTRKPNRTQFIQNPKNLGLGAALNLGVHEAMRVWPETQYLLLLDQDSIPNPGAIQKLFIACQQLIHEHGAMGCVGPHLIDPATGLSHGFHCIKNCIWARNYREPTHIEPVSCSGINGSGTLMPVALFNALGGLDEGLFIDHVDTDWSFRVLATGGFLYGIPDAVFHHSMGESCKRFWFGRWRTYPMRSPLRHYFLFRNAVNLMKRSYVPFVWKFWAAVKLILTFMIHLFFDRERFLQAKSMLKGILNGLFCNSSDIGKEIK